MRLGGCLGQGKSKQGPGAGVSQTQTQTHGRCRWAPFLLSVTLPYLTSPHLDTDSTSITLAPRSATLHIHNTLHFTLHTSHFTRAYAHLASSGQSSQPPGRCQMPTCRPAIQILSAQVAVQQRASARLFRKVAALARPLWASSALGSMLTCPRRSLSPDASAHS